MRTRQQAATAILALAMAAMTACAPPPASVSPAPNTSTSASASPAPAPQIPAPVPGSDFTQTCISYDCGYNLEGDSEPLWAGVTVKPYWFYHDGTTTQEYTGKPVTTAELAAYPGAGEILTATLDRLNSESFPSGGIDFDGVLAPVQWRFLDALVRDNGILNINYCYDYTYPKAETGGGARRYDTLLLEGERVTLLESGEGLYYPAMAEVGNTPATAPRILTEPSIRSAPANLALLEEVTKIYLWPLVPTDSALSYSWQSPAELAPDDLVDICAYNNLLRLPTKPEDSSIFGGGEYQNPDAPAEKVEKLLQNYFAVTTEQLRRSSRYNAATDSYRLGSGWSGGKDYTALSATMADGKIIVGVGLASDQDPTPQPVGTLTLELTQNRTVRYLSYQPAAATA